MKTFRDKEDPLTKDFWPREFFVSVDYPEIARAMRPTPYHLSNLHLLCATILQPTRSHFGVPVRVLSGYRDIRLNVAVHGNTGSIHPEGKASDITTPDVTMLPAMFEFIRTELPFAWLQLIYYADRNFVHVGLPHLGAPRICEVRGRSEVQHFEGG